MSKNLTRPTLEIGLLSTIALTNLIDKPTDARKIILAYAALLR